MVANSITEQMKKAKKNGENLFRVDIVTLRMFGIVIILQIMENQVTRGNRYGEIDDEKSNNE